MAAWILRTIAGFQLEKFACDVTGRPGAALVFNHDLLAQRLGQRRLQQPGGHLDAATGRIGHDKIDGLVRLRRCISREGRQGKCRAAHHRKQWGERLARTVNHCAQYLADDVGHMASPWFF